MGVDKALTPSARHVLLVLATYRRRDTGRAWPGIDTLARDTGWNRRTVIRALDAIEAAGILTPVQPRRFGRLTQWQFPPVDNPPKGDTVAPSKGDISTAKGDTVSEIGDTVSPELPEPLITPAAENEIADPELARAWLADIRRALDGEDAALCERLELERYGAAVPPVAGAPPPAKALPGLAL